MSNEHSPLPWEHGGNGLIYAQCVGDDDEAPCVADVIADRDRAAFGILTDVETANVNLIVHACNLHADLIARLRQALLILNGVPRVRIRDTDSYVVAAEITCLLARESEVRP